MQPLERSQEWGRRCLAQGGNCVENFDYPNGQDVETEGIAEHGNVVMGTPQRDAGARVG